METMRVKISGLVQGVGFRYYAMKHAAMLGICGYAKNLWSGDVEVVAEGSRTVLEQFLERLREGPRSAVVTGIRVEWEEGAHGYSSFEVR
ncbi:MAG: acylphosphatase [Bacteroidota bacterium]|nr:acylphosphatase [Bacteroidota bacterium]